MGLRFISGSSRLFHLAPTMVPSNLRRTKAIQGRSTRVTEAGSDTPDGTAMRRYPRVVLPLLQRRWMRQASFAQKLFPGTSGTTLITEMVGRDFEKIPLKKHYNRQIYCSKDYLKGQQWMDVVGDTQYVLLNIDKFTKVPWILSFGATLDAVWGDRLSAAERAQLDQWTYHEVNEGGAYIVKMARKSSNLDKPVVDVTKPQVWGYLALLNQQMGASQKTYYFRLLLGEEAIRMAEQNPEAQSAVDDENRQMRFFVEGDFLGIYSGDQYAATWLGSTAEEYSPMTLNYTSSHGAVLVAAVTGSYNDEGKKKK